MGGQRRWFEGDPALEVIVDSCVEIAKRQGSMGVPGVEFLFGRVRGRCEHRGDGQAPSAGSEEDAESPRAVSPLFLRRS